MSLHTHDVCNVRGSVDEGFMTGFFGNGDRGDRQTHSRDWIGVGSQIQTRKWGINATRPTNDRPVIQTSETHTTTASERVREFGLGRFLAVSPSLPFSLPVLVEWFRPCA